MEFEPAVGRSRLDNGRIALPVRFSTSALAVGRIATAGGVIKKRSPDPWPCFAAGVLPPRANAPVGGVESAGGVAKEGEGSAGGVLVAGGVALEGITAGGRIIVCRGGQGQD